MVPLTTNNYFTMAFKDYHKVTDNKICGFGGDYDFLSNYYICPVVYAGCEFSSSEAAFQAAKTTDPELHKLFQCFTPGKSKVEGRKLTIREDWDNVKGEVMLEILLDKFKRNPDLLEQLMATGDRELEETNHWGDTYWGVDSETGEGKNILGKVLMIVRGALKDWSPKSNELGN